MYQPQICNPINTTYGQGWHWALHCPLHHRTFDATPCWETRLRIPWIVLHSAQPFLRIRIRKGCGRRMWITDPTSAVPPALRQCAQYDEYAVRMAGYVTRPCASDHETNMARSRMIILMVMFFNKVIFDSQGECRGSKYIKIYKLPASSQNICGEKF